MRNPEPAQPGHRGVRLAPAARHHAGGRRGTSLLAQPERQTDALDRDGHSRRHGGVVPRDHAEVHEPRQQPHDVADRVQVGLDDIGSEASDRDARRVEPSTSRRSLMRRAISPERFS